MSLYLQIEVRNAFCIMCEEMWCPETSMQREALYLSHNKPSQVWMRGFLRSLLAVQLTQQQNGSGGEIGAGQMGGTGQAGCREG